MKKYQKFITLSLAITATTALSGCFGSSEEEAAAVTTPRYLYVSSGACFSGNATAQNGSRTLVRYNLTSGSTTPEIMYDFNADPALPTPTAIKDDGDYILVATADNAAAGPTGGDKAIYRINKTSKSKFSYYQDTTVLTTGNVIRHLNTGTYGGSTLIISDATKIEKVSRTSFTRILAQLAAVTAFINAPNGGSCTTMATNLNGSFETTSGRIVAIQGAANGRIGVFDKDGVDVIATDCNQGVAMANSGLFVAATGQPTSLLLHSSGKLLMSAGSSATNASNAVLAFDFDDSSTATPITSQTLAYYLPTVGLNQPSAMAEDVTGGKVYLASYASGTIESFTFDSSTKTLTRVATAIPASAYTNCVSGMFVGN
jgi:hypothetical protein